MPGTIVIGAQWGDEGKAKVIDFLLEKSQHVVRFQGGDNAGHTVVVGDATYKFHCVPCGGASNKKLYIAQGVVLNPIQLIKEIDDLEKKGHDVQLMIDSHTSIIMPWHIDKDKALENKRGKNKIGTTAKGIGPCYEDKANRKRNISFGDLTDHERLEQKIIEIYPQYKEEFETNGYAPLNYNEHDLMNDYILIGQLLTKYRGDVSAAVQGALIKEHVFFEGAQGTLLDVGFGTTPFVTSSHTIAANALVGTGIPPQNLKVIGVVKAYVTRVGAGPFPTKITGTLGDEIRKLGNEYGTTTGRPRDVGWLDIPLLKYSKKLNGFQEIALTKLDVLVGLEKIKVCIGYKYKGGLIQEIKDLAVLNECEPIYIEFDGFNKLGHSYEEFPEEAKKYVNFIAQELGVKFTLISTGPERSQTILF